MTLSKKLRDALLKRDAWCWHCGTGIDLVPHHRINRGSGGSKALDRVDNLILVCHNYNFAMEADAEVAKEARLDGHKLRRYQTTEAPLLDKCSGIWYVLDLEGGKHELRGLSLADETAGNSNRGSGYPEPEF
jgi:hypothetical protein